MKGVFAVVDFEMTSILSLLAEMNSFSEINDELSVMVNRFDDSELSEDDLSLVSAAYTPMPFSELLKKHKREQ